MAEKTTLIGDRTFFSIGLLIPIAMVIGAWFDFSGDLRVAKSEIAKLQQEQEKTDERYLKIIDSLSDMKADLRAIQNQLSRK